MLDDDVDDNDCICDGTNTVPHAAVDHALAGGSGATKQVSSIEGDCPLEGTIMNTRTLIFCGLISAVGFQAHAGEAASPSNPTRAEVRQETLRAIAAGEVSYGDVERMSPAATTAGKTRAEVRDELRAAIAAGETWVGDIDPNLFAATRAHARRTLVAVGRNAR